MIFGIKDDSELAKALLNLLLDADLSLQFRQQGK